MTLHLLPYISYYKKKNQFLEFYYKKLIIIFFMRKIWLFLCLSSSKGKKELNIEQGLMNSDLRSFN